MRLTPNLALPVPEPADNTQLWQHFGGLADTIDAQAGTGQWIPLKANPPFTASPADPPVLWVSMGYVRLFGTFDLSGGIVEQTLDMLAASEIPSKYRPKKTIRGAGATSASFVRAASTVRLEIKTTGRLSYFAGEGNKGASWVNVDGLGWPLAANPNAV